MGRKYVSKQVSMNVIDRSLENNGYALDGQNGCSHLIAENNQIWYTNNDTRLRLRNSQLVLASMN